MIRKLKFRYLRKRIVENFSILFHRIQCIRLRADSTIARLFFPQRFRILATACWSFPIYSQTFVYQELTQLIRKGFQVRFLYSNQDSRKQLPSQFNALWHSRKRLNLHHKVCQRDYEYFAKRMPEKIDQLVDLICQASGVRPEELRAHHHFQEAFAFTRMVKAYRPDYLHTYFFYEGTFFGLVASYLLGIPRGVSCYADHMLQDYVFKLVPLHLEQCSLVIATSYQIKQELLRILRTANPNNIIIKPNAINAEEFPVVKHAEPKNEEPYRLVSVSRIEPKKGLLFLSEAIQTLRQRGFNVEWHLIGDVDGSSSSKDYAQKLRARIGELNLTGYIHLEGQKSESEIKEFFRRSHLFIAPFVQTESGDKDGIPTSLLEGMSSGLPVVATNAGSIPEVIEEALDGILVPQRDSDALADAIAQLLKDSERRSRLGKNAAKKIRERFDVRVCETTFHDSLSRLLSLQRRIDANQDNKPLVTVIMIFFNARKFMNEAIESVFAQTYKNWELLLVDDGSSDESTHIAKRCAQENQDRVRYLEHTGHQNHGMSATRNLGVRNARGEYVAFIDADDFWFPHKLERQVAILETERRAQMIYGATQYWHGWTNQPTDLEKDYIPELGVTHQTVTEPPGLIPLLHPFGAGTAPCPSDLMIRRKTIEQLGGFEEHFQGKFQFFEDQAFLAKMYLNHPVFVSNECWDKHRYHPESCDSVVTASGESDSVRRYFLEWFERYLSERKIKDGAVWNTVQKALSKAGKSTNPTGSQHLEWGSFRRLKPISLDWGFDRGLPIDRYYIESFLAQHADDIHDRTLEIEDDMYTSRFGGNRTTVRDVLHVEEGNPKATIVADLTCAEHIPDNRFDCVVLTQTLQLIYDTRAALRTIHRILKPGGVLLATFPGITRISHTEWSGSWYWAFTSTSARSLFGEFFPTVNVQVYGNVLAATAFLQGVATEELKPEELDYQDPDYEVLIALRAVKA